MSDTSPPPSTDYEEPHVEQENKLTSERFDEFKEALEVLYVIANLSGRNNFTKDWPLVAEYVFGKELIAYDREGTDDKEHRSELEAAAEERRIQLLEFMDTIEKKSVEKGALQMDYVRDAINGYGRELALLMYSTKIVDRFVPPPPEAPKPDSGEAIEDSTQPAAPAQKENADVSASPAQEEKSLRVLPEDPMDRIKPIDMEEPPKPAETPPPPNEPAPVPPPAEPPTAPPMDTPQTPVTPDTQPPETPVDVGQGAVRTVKGSAAGMTFVSSKDGQCKPKPTEGEDQKDEGQSS